MNRNLKIVLLKTNLGRLLFKPYGYNKFLLLLMGFALLRWTGLIAGFIIGCILDMQFIVKKSLPKSADMRLNYLMLGAYILQVTHTNKYIHENEINERLSKQLGKEFIQKRGLFFKELMHQRVQVNAICKQFLHVQQEEKTTLIKFLFELSWFENINRIERDAAIQYVAAQIEFSSDFVRFFSIRFYNGHDVPVTLFSVFALSENATYTDLKKAYYKLAKKIHPDTARHASEKEQKQLQEKFRHISETYEHIKQLKGWK